MYGQLIRGFLQTLGSSKCCQRVCYYAVLCLPYAPLCFCKCGEMFGHVPSPCFKYAREVRLKVTFGTSWPHRLRPCTIFHCACVSSCVKRWRELFFSTSCGVFFSSTWDIKPKYVWIMSKSHTCDVIIPHMEGLLCLYTLIRNRDTRGPDLILNVGFLLLLM